MKHREAAIGLGTPASRSAVPADLLEIVRGPTPHAGVALSRRQPGGTFAETTYEALWQRACQVGALLGGMAPGWFMILAGKSADSVACMVAAMAAGRPFCAPNPKYRGPQIARILEVTGAPLCAIDATGLLALRGALREYPRIAQTRWLLFGGGTLAGPAAEVAGELRTVATVLDIKDIVPPAMATSQRGVSDPKFPATCLFTSGSTGEPKGVVISAGDLHQRAAAEVECFSLSARDVLLNIVPLSYDLGLNQLLTALTVGAELVLLDSWLPTDILAAVEQRRATGISAVPVIWHDMLQSGLRFDRGGRHASLRYVTISGGDLSPAELQRLPAVVGGAGIFKTYGQQEAFRATALRPADYMHKRESVGTPFPGVRVSVVREDGTPCEPGEAGEIVHSGIGVMLGYLGAGGTPEASGKVRPNPFRGPESPSANAVFTGDTGYLDAEGYLYIKGRRDSMIKVSGNRVYPLEVTNQVLTLPDIRDALVLGIPGADGQTALVAFLVATGQRSPDVGTIRRLLRARLPAFMVPKELVFVERIPCTDTGKPDANKLLASLRHGAAQP